MYNCGYMQGLLLAPICRVLIITTCIDGIIQISLMGVNFMRVFPLPPPQHQYDQQYHCCGCHHHHHHPYQCPSYSPSW